MSMDEWIATPLGRYLIEREQAYFDQVVADIFGFNALQIGFANPTCCVQTACRSGSLLRRNFGKREGGD